MEAISPVGPQVFKGETVTAVAWSPSGAEMLAAGSGPVRILSPATGKVLREARARALWDALPLYSKTPSIEQILFWNIIPSSCGG